MANNYLEFSELIDDLTEEEAEWVRNIPDRIDFEDNEKYKNEEEWQKAFSEALKQHGIDGDELIAEGLIYSFPQFAWETNNERKTWWVSTHNEEYGDPFHVAIAVQGFIRKFRPDYVFKLTWCEYCSKPRIGEFGGGWCVVNKDEYLFGNTWQDADEHAEALKTGDSKL